MRIILSVISIWILLTSCIKDDKSKEIQTKIVQRSGDTIKVIYYEDGSKSETTLKDGKPHGLQKNYNENGTFRSKKTWMNGQLYSHQFEYFVGIYDTINVIDKGDTLLSIRSILNRYDYINGKGAIAFTMEYNTDSSIRSMKGKSAVEYRLDKETYEINELVRIRITYPLINYDYFSSVLAFSDENGRILELDTLNINEDYMISDHDFVLNKARDHFVIINKWIFGDTIFQDTSFTHPLKVSFRPNN